MTPRSRKESKVFDKTVTFQLGDVCALTGAKRSQVEYWVRKGVIVPDVVAADGAGKYRAFSLLNLVDFALAVRLNRLSIPVKLIASAVLRFREFHRECEAIYRLMAPAQVEWAAARGTSVAPATSVAPVFTAEQRAALHEAFADACLRRDAFGRASKASFPRRSREYYVKHAMAREISASEQRLTLLRAMNWRMFCKNQETRRAMSEAGTFFGVFVFEGEMDAQVVDETSSLRELVVDAAVVVTFERLLNVLENRANVLGLLDGLFQ
jgi:DNA-binding transcriptional MerR regulator